MTNTGIKMAGVRRLQRRSTAALALAAAALALASCATTTASGPVEVSRFHLGAPLERGSVIVEPLPGGGPASLEFKTYAAAVETELLKSGYTAPGPISGAQYLAIVGFTRTSREGPSGPPPVSIGLGAGGYSGGAGVGGGITLPIGKGRRNVTIVTELSVQLRRRSDSTVIWEGHAVTAADLRAVEANAGAAAGKLASAMFQGFPGESGRTITVR